MKKLSSALLGFVLAIVLTLIASATTASAQETMLKKAGDTVTDNSKKVYRKGKKVTKRSYNRGKRVGHTVGDKTWNGTRWVASSSYRGGKWIAVKTANGTKWVYRKARRETTKRLP